MKYNINLIRRKDFSFVDKILYFFLNYLRYVLVITQFVVIGVLFYRFKIDQNIIDLKDSIDQKQNIIEVVTPLLEEANKIDLQMQAVKGVNSDQEKLSQSLAYLLSVFPEDLSLQNLSIENASFKLDGYTQNPKQLQQFYIKLNKDKRFNQIALNNIKKGDLGYSFEFQLSEFKK
ncbi:MAG: PilN domain-containing protein [Patescibacteria group bacterium]